MATRYDRGDKDLLDRNAQYDPYGFGTELLQDYARGIPERLDARLEGEAQAAAAAAKAEADAATAFSARSDELDAEQITWLEGQLSALQAQRAMFNDEDDPELAAESDEYIRGLQGHLQGVRDRQRSVTPAEFASGRAPAAPADPLDPLIASRLGQAGRKAGESREDFVTRMAQTHDIDMQSLQQEWNSAESSLDRSHESVEAARKAMVDQVMQGLSFKNDAARDATRADLERELQAGQQEHDMAMQRSQQKFTMDLTNLTNRFTTSEREAGQAFTADEAGLDRELNRTVTRWKIDSDEDVEAAKLLLQRWGKEQDVEVAWAVQALDERIFERDDRNGYRDQALATIASYAGSDDPADQAVIADVIERAGRVLGAGPQSYQYDAIIEAGVAAGSPAARDARQQSREATRQSTLTTTGQELLNEGQRISNMAGREGITMAELEREIKDFNHRDARLRAFYEDASSAAGVATSAAMDGDVETLRTLMSVANGNPDDYPPGLHDAVQGMDFPGLLAEAEAVSAARAGDRNWQAEHRDQLRTEFDQDVTRFENELRTDDITYAQAVQGLTDSIRTAADKTVEGIEDRDELDAYIHSLKRKPADFEAAGGEQFERELQRAFTAKEALQRRTDEQVTVDALLAAAVDTQHWQDLAIQGLMRHYKMGEEDAEAITQRLRTDAGDAGVMADLAFKKLKAEVEDMNTVDAPTFAELRQAHKDLFEGSLAILESTHADCAARRGGLLEDLYGAAGSPLECTPDKRAAYQRDLDELDLQYQLLAGNLLGTALTGRARVSDQTMVDQGMTVEGAGWFNFLSKSEQESLFDEFSQFVSFETPEGYSDEEWAQGPYLRMALMWLNGSLSGDDVDILVPTGKGEFERVTIPWSDTELGRKLRGELGWSEPGKP